ncbi:MAG: XTP/dITP diphosphatase [Lachnospiraceae bacterium]|nr:XTP/dITP diphosphatase [Lachnospiraceae bacterium]
MDNTIIFATGNEGKVREIRAILADTPYHVITMKEAGIDLDIEEDGATFTANAVIKAKAVATMTDHIVLADDSGLEIDALHGEPGVLSARYMGKDTSYDLKNQNLIDRLEGLDGEKRSARFVCAVAACLPDKTILTTVGTMEGRIAYEIKGTNGFGYDPIFFLPKYGMTSAEISPEEKNEISHRGKALRQMGEVLKNL